MEKRVLLATALSVFVLMLWSNIVGKYQHQPPSATSQPPPSVSIETASAIPEKSFEIAPQKISKISTQQFDVEFDEEAAAIREITFPKYKSYKFSLLNSFSYGDGFIYKKISETAHSVLFQYEDEEKIIKKEFNFSNSNSNIELEITVENISQKAFNPYFPLAIGSVDFSRPDIREKFFDLVVSQDNKINHPNLQKEATFENVQFVALREKYFCLIVEPLTSGFFAVNKRLKPNISAIALIQKDGLLQIGQKSSEKFLIFVGPQDAKLLSSTKNAWAGIIHFGTFDIISNVLLQILFAINSVIHNWGVSIILLSIVIYLILYPLSYKQMHSMKQMQALQPRIEEIRHLYKDNPQKMNKEVMDLYMKNKVNPLGGCLPMLLQIPVFFALYQALMRSIALKGAPFLWIKDLSEPDRLFMLPTSLPLIGNEFNLLPILMSIGMFLQQKMTSVSTGGTSAEQQKMMMILFPIIFTFVFYHMPSGLVLYWFINSTLMLLAQIYTLKKK